jgi:hypothetical protein
MALKLYLIVSGLIFLLVSIFHFFRLLYGWPVLVGPYAVPFVLSYVGLPVSTGYWLWAAWLMRKCYAASA